MKTSFAFVFRRRLQDAIRRLDQGEQIGLSHTSPEDIFKTNIFVLIKRLQNVLPRRLQNIFKTSCKSVFKMFSRRLQDAFKTSARRFRDVLKTSSRPTLKSCSFPIHRLGGTKNSHEPPANRNFFFAISLSEKIYD